MKTQKKALHLDRHTLRVLSTDTLTGINGGIVASPTIDKWPGSDRCIQTCFCTDRQTDSLANPTVVKP